VKLLHIWQPLKTEVWTPDKSDYNWITEDIAVGMQPRDNDAIEELIDDGISNILCLHRVALPYDPFKYNIGFEHIKIADGALMPLECAKSGINFISNSLQKKEKILVHCEMGVSRSPMMVVLYLITHGKMDFKTALSYVIEKRPSAHPFPNLVDLDLVINLLHYYYNLEKNKE